MFPPPKLPSPGQFLLITDELAAPADFFLHKSLGAHLKDNKNSRCVLLSVSGGMTRWKTIAAKSVSIGTACLSASACQVIINHS
jgi:hypothetical protein